MNRKQRQIMGNHLFNSLAIHKDSEVIRRDVELEQSAIDEYTEQLKSVSPELQTILKHIIKEEKEHKEMLEKFVNGKW